jgi:hypothetical protein
MPWSNRFKNVAYFYESECSATTGCKWLGGERRVRLVARYATLRYTTLHYATLNSLAILAPLPFNRFVSARWLLSWPYLADYRTLWISRHRWCVIYVRRTQQCYTRNSMASFFTGLPRCLVSVCLTRSKDGDFRGKIKRIYWERQIIVQIKISKTTRYRRNFQKFWASKNMSGHDTHEGVEYHASSIILLARTISWLLPISSDRMKAWIR